MTQPQNSAQAQQALTAAQIDTMAKLSAKHAEERARLEGDQHNQRVALVERQRKEAQAAAAAVAPVVPPAETTKKKK